MEARTSSGGHGLDTAMSYGRAQGSATSFLANVMYPV